MLKEGKPHDSNDAQRGAGQAPPDNGPPTGRRPPQEAAEEIKARLKQQHKTDANEDVQP
jgi:hypothetical protein